MTWGIKWRRWTPINITGCEAKNTRPDVKSSVLVTAHRRERRPVDQDSTADTSRSEATLGQHHQGAKKPAHGPQHANRPSDGDTRLSGSSGTKTGNSSTKPKPNTTMSVTRVANQPAATVTAPLLFGALTAPTVTKAATTPAKTTGPTMQGVNTNPMVRLDCVSATLEEAPMSETVPPSAASTSSDGGRPGVRTSTGGRVVLSSLRTEQIVEAIEGVLDRRREEEKRQLETHILNVIDEALQKQLLPSLNRIAQAPMALTKGETEAIVTGALQARDAARTTARPTLDIAQLKQVCEVITQTMRAKAACRSVPWNETLADITQISTGCAPELADLLVGLVKETVAVTKDFVLANGFRDVDPEEDDL